MTHSATEHRSERSRLSTGKLSVQIRELAEAGARGHALSSQEVKQVCEALRAQSYTVRNQFHSNGA